MLQRKVAPLTYGRGYTYALRYCVVWCVKNRQQILRGSIIDWVRKELYSIATEYNFAITNLDLRPDHIRIIIDCSPQHFLPTLVKVMKGNTARKGFILHPELKKEMCDGHMWEPSYFVTTHSEMMEEQIDEYLKGRKK